MAVIKIQQHPLFRFFSSLKLAVVLILSLAFILAVATGIESVYGMRAVKTLVYGTHWFAGVLSLLGVILTCAAFSRYPWKRHQTGFVMTHTGIITIIIGSWITSQFGVDGNLPVSEGSQNSEVILNDLVLGVSEEDTRLAQLTLPEYARRKTGDLYTVQIGRGRLQMDEFLPRATVERVVRESPIEGVGRPAVSVTIENDRFSLTEWLTHREPGQATDLSLGPAMLSFDVLADSASKMRFEAGGNSGYGSGSESKLDPGLLIVDKGGKSYRVRIVDAIKEWMRVGGGILLKVERYLPYAIVSNGKLVSKSREPRNPAVTIRIRDQEGVEEKHTVFAFFPEFATHHREKFGVKKSGAKKPAGDKNLTPSLGVKIRMVVEPARAEAMRGQLRLAQSNDGEQLYYRTLTRSSGESRRGNIVVGESVATGWMDLNFRVDRWIKHSVVEQVPHYVDKISGSDANFVAAAHFKFSGTGLPQDEFWLFEGAERVLPFTEGVYVASLKRRILGLPFQIQLDKFTVHHDPGTQKAAGYESMVTVRGANGNRSSKISMNEPMQYGGYTFYQASFQLNENAPPVSIFSVNLDPGRWVKYAGSLLITLGILIMFYMNPHYWNVLMGTK